MMLQKAYAFVHGFDTTVLCDRLEENKLEEKIRQRDYRPRNSEYHSASQ